MQLARVRILYVGMGDLALSAAKKQYADIIPAH
jgi:hypothetical protein